MQRVLRLGCLMLIVLGLCTRPAEANPWDWMEELSGPGPFHTGGNVMGTICFTKTLTRKYDATSSKPCLFFDVRRFISNDKDNFREFAKVEATAYDFGLTWEVRRPVDIGLGAGVIHFTSNKKGTTRATLIAPRVQIKPLLFLARPGYWTDPDHARGRRWASILKWYARESLIVGKLDAEDFGVSAAKSDFKVKNDRVTSMGFLLDFTELWRTP